MSNSVVVNIYNHIKGIASPLASVRHFDWYNSDITNGTSFPFNLPSVFFECDITWNRNIEGNTLDDCKPGQKGLATIVLHYIYGKKDRVAIDASEINQLDGLFDLVWRVNGSTTNGVNGAIIRVRDANDISHDQLKDWTVTFEAKVFESGYSGIDLSQRVVVTPPIDLEQDLGLDIPTL